MHMHTDVHMHAYTYTHAFVYTGTNVHTHHTTLHPQVPVSTLQNEACSAVSGFVCSIFAGFRFILCSLYPQQ